MARVIPLSEGVFTIGHDRQFMPFDPEHDVLEDRPRGSLLVEVQPFLVETGKELLLLDTGLGFRDEDGTMQLHRNIRAHGYDPADVTRVLLSHLHKDHAGGLGFYEADGTYRPAFPEAVYHIYKPEADFAMETGKPSFHDDEIRPLLESGLADWLEGESGTVGEGITFRHSGGHSPQHIVYLIDDGGDKLFFGGDEAPQLKQMKMRYVARYDYDGKRASMLREQYGEQGRKEGWQFLFYHDIRTPVARL